MHFLLKYPFGDFKQKIWWLQLACLSWQRDPNPPIRPPYISYPPSSNFVHPLLSCCLQPHPHCSFSCLVSLAELVIASHLRCAILLNDIMDVHMPSLRTLMRLLCNKESSFIVCLGASSPLQKHQAPPPPPP